MKYIRKMLAVLLTAVIMASSIGNTTAAGLKTIHESSSIETITAGATLERITRFTEDGWLNINVLRVDLSNKYIKVDSLYNKDSVNKLISTKVLAETNGAIAALNASFFDWTKEPGTGRVYGPVISSDGVVSAATRVNSDLATLSVNNLNQILIDYWKTEIKLVAPSETVIDIGQYNRESYEFSDISIYDRKWGEYSPGVTTNHPTVNEMVVDNGKVVEFRDLKPPVKIPENGFVVSTGVGGMKKLKSSFKVGDTVSFDIKTTPDWKKLKMAMTGGAVLVKDGVVPKTFTHSVYATARHPRSGMGSSKDGKQLILVAVDGRQKDSLGMTQLEFAELMRELGGYNSMNLDGGGSTTMVARTPGTQNIEIVNSPSDGYPRRVIDAVGIFSIAPPSELAGLIIDTENTDTFVNTSREFSVRGYDRYFNPITVNPANVVWKVSGVKGSFKGNIFSPVQVGAGKVTATVGGVSASLDVSVLSSPVKLELSRKSMQLDTNQTLTLSVKGTNKNGYTADIRPSDVSWKVNGDVGKIVNGSFTASGKGAGYIDAYVGKTHAYCEVSVATSTKTIKDRFDTKSGTFIASPADSGGRYEQVTVKRYSGKASGKLVYDFTKNLDKTRAAYLEYPDKGIALDENTHKLGLWVYNDHKNANWLGAWIYDNKDKLHYVYFSKNMDWEGWKYVEMTMDEVGKPSRLKRIYLVQTNPVSDSGEIYLDNLTAMATQYPKLEEDKLPKDTVPVDEANKAVTYPKGTDLLRFSVFAQNHEPGVKETTQKALLEKLGSLIKNNFNAAAFVGGSEHATVKSLKKPFISTNKDNKVFDIKTSRFIQLDMRKDGLRATNPGQWTWLLQQLSSFKGNNAFVFLANSPDAFSDSKEAALFKEILSQYRKKNSINIWVFYKDSKNASYMENGVKYISTAGFDVPDFTAKNQSPAKYVLVTVKGSTLTYEWKSIA